MYVLLWDAVGGRRPFIAEAGAESVLIARRRYGEKGAMTGLVYKRAPQNVFHSWVEVYFEETWYELEAFILDKQYLEKLQAMNTDCVGGFCGYGVAVKNFQHPIIDFNRNNTYIQSEGIIRIGVYDCFDDLLKELHQELSLIKKPFVNVSGETLRRINFFRILMKLVNNVCQKAALRGKHAVGHIF